MPRYFIIEFNVENILISSCGSNLFAKRLNNSLGRFTQNISISKTLTFKIFLLDESV